MDNSAQNSQVVGDGGALQDDSAQPVVSGTTPNQLQDQDKPQAPQFPMRGSVAKEEEPFGAPRSADFGGYESSGNSEVAPIVEVGEVEINPEIQEFIQEEKKANLELGERVVHKGEILVEPAQDSDLPEVVLPLTKDSMSSGMGSNVGQSARWLAEWCLKIIKKFHGRVVYATREDKKD